jgi:hypothetical protein
MRLLLLALPVAAALGWVREARACSVCGCGDPLVDASDSVPYATPLRLALDFEYLTASARSDDMPLATESLTQITVRPVVVYSPTESLNLVAELPIVRKDWSLAGGGLSDSAAPVGVGDVDLGLRWFFFRPVDFENMTRQALGLLVGVTLPTGADDATADGERLDDHAQLGAGSFGPYAGLSYAWHHDPWNAYTSAALHLHGTNGYGYHYAPSLSWTARLDYRVHDRVALEGGLDGRWAGHDTASDEEQENTGGLVLAAAPGLAVNPAGDVWLRARVQIPFLADLYGVQSVGITAFASVQVLVR